MEIRAGVYLTVAVLLTAVDGAQLLASGGDDDYVVGPIPDDADEIVHSDGGTKRGTAGAHVRPNARGRVTGKTAVNNMGTAVDRGGRKIASPDRSTIPSKYHVGLLSVRESDYETPRPLMQGETTTMTTTTTTMTTTTTATGTTDGSGGWAEETSPAGGSFGRAKTASATVKHGANGELENASSINNDMDVYGYDDNNYYNNNNGLRTKSGETNIGLPDVTSRTGFGVSPDGSFRRSAQTAATAYEGDGVGGQTTEIKRDSETSSSNDSLRSFNVRHDGKNFVYSDGHVTGMPAGRVHSVMPPRSRMGRGSRNGGPKKKRENNLARGGRGSRAVVGGKNLPRKTRKSHAKTKSKTRSDGSKSRGGRRKSNKRNGSSSSSSSDSDESETTRRERCDHPKRNNDDHFQTDDKMSPAGRDSTAILRPPPTVEQKKTIVSKRRTVHGSSQPDSAISTASNNIPIIYQQRFESPNPNGLTNQYGPFPFYGPPPTQRPPPDFKYTLPPHFPRSGLPNLTKPPSASEHEQRTNDVPEATRDHNGHSEFITQRETLQESPTSKTLNNRIGNADQNVRCVQTISDKMGIDNPLEMRVVKLESFAPLNEQLLNRYSQPQIFPQMSGKGVGEGSQTSGVEKFLTPLPPIPGLSNLLSGKGRQTKDNIGLAKNNGETVAVSNQMDTLNSNYIMTTNTQSSATSDSYDGSQDAEQQNWETTENSEKIDGNYSPEAAHVLQTKSYTAPPIPRLVMPFQNYVKGGGGNGGGNGGGGGGGSNGGGGGGNGGGNGFAEHDWRKYLPSFVNLPSGPAQEQRENNIVQSDSENPGLQQMNTFTTKSMTTAADAKSSADGSSMDGYTKITKTTKQIGVDNPKELHIVQSETKKPGNKGFGYSYSYSY